MSNAYHINKMDSVGQLKVLRNQTDKETDHFDLNNVVHVTEFCRKSQTISFSNQLRRCTLINRHIYKYQYSELRYLCKQLSLNYLKYALTSTDYNGIKVGLVDVKLPVNVTECVRFATDRSGLLGNHIYGQCVNY